MSLPTMTGTGRLTADPELRYSPSGTAVCTVNLAFNSRRKNQQGEWEDGDVMFVRATAFRELAEHMAETLAKGTEVNVTGRLKLDQWQDKETNEKRSAVVLLIDAIGPNLRYATANVRKAERNGGGSAGGDPWRAPPANEDQPPF